MKGIKKAIILLLTLCLLMSACPTWATEHWAKDEIDFALENGLWKLGDFDPDSPVTRAETAGLMAYAMGAAIPEMREMYTDVNESTVCGKEIISVSLSGLMQGADGMFRPDDSLTREEMAVILDRMYRMMGENVEGEILKSRFKDSGEISEWALKSIYNVSAAQIMSGTAAKEFSPKKIASKAEAITAMVRYNKACGMRSPNFSIRDAKDVDAKSTFEVYQTATMVPKAGVGGWAVVAQFDGAPGEIYVSRTTSEENKYELFEPTAIARVTDPDGNVAAIVDFTELKSGKQANIISIPNGKPGNYTIAVMNGRRNDVFEIAVSGCKYWGVRGEKVISGCTTLPQEVYLYAQKKADDVYIGVRDTSNSTKLFDLNGKLVAQAGKPSTNLEHHNSTIESAIAPDAVYKLVLPKGYQDHITIEGIPGLMCPTKEAAEALKGGWVEYDGITFQTPLAARARAEIVRLASTKNLDVNITYPETWPKDLENPEAEAQMFGEYGVISGLSGSVNRQILDPKNKWCGRVLDYDEFKAGQINEIRNSTGDFESGFYAAQEGSRAGQGALGMAMAATMPLELNYAFGNEALITRAAMGILVTSYGLSEDGYYRTYIMKNNTYPMIGGMFIWSYLIEAYERIRGYLDQSTREIIDEMMNQMADKQGDYFGLGVNNQGMFCVKDRLIWYKMTGDERHHEAFKRQMVPFIHKSNSQYGYQQPGHFAEIGCDGSYEYMGRVEFYNIYNIYKKLANADQKLLEEMRFVVEDTMYFESMHTLPQPENSSIWLIAPNHFSSRTDTPLGGGNNPSYEQVFNEFPIAARRMQVFNGAQAGGYPHKINSPEYAEKQFERYYPLYHTYSESRNDGRYGHWWPSYTYDAYNADEYVEPCLLPCEEEDGLIIDREGFIAVKHKGIYLTSFYYTDVLDVYWLNTSYAYMGGGPTAIYNGTTGSTLVSQKHYSGTSKPKTTDDILSSCITGTVGGKFFYSGKERPKFEWLEENKKFQIRGLVPDTGKNAVWTYELTDTGIDMTAGIETMGSMDELWVNLPIVMNDAEKESKVTVEPGKLSFTMNGATMTYTWDAALEYEFLDPKTRIENAVFSRLRVKIPAEVGSVTFHIQMEE